MNFILKYEYRTKFNLDYRTLAEHMWFDTFQGQPIDINHYGGNELLNVNHVFGLRWNKWANDQRWAKKEYSWTAEDIELTRFKKIPTNLFVTTTHKKVLSVDERALYRFIYALTAPVAAWISSDDGDTWQTPEEFKKEHRLLMNMKFELANEMSLVESETLSPEEEEDRDDVVY